MLTLGKVDAINNAMFKLMFRNWVKKILIKILVTRVHAVKAYLSEIYLHLAAFQLQNRKMLIFVECSEIK